MEIADEWKTLNGTRGGGNKLELRELITGLPFVISLIDASVDTHLTTSTPILRSFVVGTRKPAVDS